ncbi:MAG: hypothetical protein ACI9WS_002416, partial [Paraglaciecola psychrophila]
MLKQFDCNLPKRHPPAATSFLPLVPGITSKFCNTRWRTILLMRSLSAFVDAGTMDIFCEMTHLFNIID